MHTVQAPADKKRRTAAEATVASLSAAEVEAAVHCEGLTLVQSADSKTGYQGVVAHGRRFKASRNKGHLGTFDSVLEAALCVARFLGPDASAAAAAGLGLVANLSATAEANAYHRGFASVGSTATNARSMVAAGHAARAVRSCLCCLCNKLARH